MLAIKTILSTADQIPILVFDEVDAGIGGRVGGVVGQKLWGLSKSHQVLCVTHLPQIACYADNHVRVMKAASRERTVTSVEVLDGEGRVVEISQMLGSGGGAARGNAVEMLEEAGEVEGRFCLAVHIWAGERGADGFWRSLSLWHYALDPSRGIGMGRRGHWDDRGGGGI